MAVRTRNSATPRAACAVLFPSSMTALIFSMFLSVSPAKPDALAQAQHEVEVTRAKWDAAVAGEHPVRAGRWAQRHFAAMQKVKQLRATR